MNIIIVLENKPSPIITVSLRHIFLKTQFVAMVERGFICMYYVMRKPKIIPALEPRSYN